MSPTGYTAGVQSGEVADFPAFVLACARAFGALVAMRDDPMDKPIPEVFEPSQYHVEHLAIACARLFEAQAWDTVTAERKAAEAHEEAVVSWGRREREREEHRGRYSRMLGLVEAWAPPTPDHTPLKKFMGEQLRQSIDFDCGHASPRPERLDGRAYKAQQIKKERWSVEYHEKENAAERERARSRTEWVAALRASLKSSPPAPPEDSGV